MATNGVFTYSQIISPLDYNKIMSEQHLYISASDGFLADTIRREAKTSVPEVVELGCGPGRILSLVRNAVPHANISAIEADEVFADYAQELCKDLDINIIIGDVETVRLERPVDIFYSQGFHHHVSGSRKTHAYLQNVYNNLTPGGTYLLSDEFLPEYTTEEEREIKAIIWYSHIIAHALLHDYYYLAREEAKTLLDDIYEGRSDAHMKSNEQIDFVLSQVTLIDNYARSQNHVLLSETVNNFQNILKSQHNLKTSGDLTIDLSRHDYKICESVLRPEVENVGFTIEEIKSFGPIKNIGAMLVYVLRK